VIKHLARALAKIRGLFRNSRVEEELAKEIATHLLYLEDEFLRQGLSPLEAHRQARLACGGVEQVKQAHREERSFRWLSQSMQDIRHACRSLLRSPGFSVASILTLALGIGANTAVFSVVNTVLLKPLSYPEPDRIVQFWLNSTEGSVPGASIPDLHFWMQRAEAVDDISAYDLGEGVLGLTSGIPEEVHGVHVTSNYFRLFGAPFVLGRAFSADEDRAGSGKVVVLSYGLWKRRFGGDPKIVGKAISLEKEPYTVVGVTGESFRTDPEADLWIPFQFNLNSIDQLHSFGAAGRLKPGLSLSQANIQLRLASQAAKRQGSLPDPEYTFVLEPLRDAIVSDARASLLLMQAAVGLVLLIACANVANLFLGRATVRKREFAIRAAIGAGRGRLLRQFATESVLLSTCGGGVGLVMASFGVHALLSISPGNIPRIGVGGASMRLDWRVLMFTLGISLLVGIVFGIIPALRICGPSLNQSLNEGNQRLGSGASQSKMRSLIVLSEVSLSVVLLIGAALLIRTFVALRSVNPGFDRHNVFLMEMSLHGSQFATTANIARLVEDARRRLAGIPGVEIAAATCSPPFGNRMGLPFTAIGTPSGNSGSTGDAEWMSVSPGYFAALRIPIIRGRDFHEQDGAGTPGVVLINETMAKRYWADRYWADNDPIGQTIEIGRGIGPNFEDRPRQIIGIVADTREHDLSDAAQPTMIIPLAQEPDGITRLWLQFGPIFWLIRTRLEPHQVAVNVSDQLREASGGLPTGQVRTMDEILSDSIARQNFNMLLLGVFAMAALALTAVGIYGVMAYSVAQRTHEIGVRMALGADRAHIRNLVVGKGMLMAGLGVIVGLAAAALLARFLAGFLFGVRAWDPMVFIAIPALLALVALSAMWIPARRAARLEPIEALRVE
jgi:putative ABC transport system permease protein